MKRRDYDYLFHSAEPTAGAWRRSAPLPELAKALKEYRTEVLDRALESDQTAANSEARPPTAGMVTNDN